MVLVSLTACGNDNGSRHIVDAPATTTSPDYIWFVLDETSGTTAKDSSSHHYDITGLTGVTWSQGANFDGTGGGGFVAVDSSYRSPPVTISAWLTATTRADRTSITGPLEPFPSNAIGDDIPGEFGYGFGLNVWSDGTPGSALTVEDFNGCSFGATFPVDCTIAGAAFTAGTEYLVTIVINTDNTAHTYVNGALYADATVGTLAVAATQFWLGRHNDDPDYGTKRFFDGRMRDVRVYKSALAVTGRCKAL